MDSAARRRLGRTGLATTALGLGCAPLGGFRGRIPEPEASGIVRDAWDAGLRYFDTAPYYGYGRSELVTGHVLREMPRDQFLLSTKVGRVMTPLRAGDDTTGLRSGGLPFRPAFDYSRDGVLRALEQSYLRLGMARIDIAYIHDVDVYTHGAEAYPQRFREAIAGAVPALVELRAQGVLGAIGVGLNEVAPALRFAREADIDVILLAGRYTLLEQAALDELLPLCLARDIAVVIGGPFNSGILVSGPHAGALYNYSAAPPEVLARAARIEAVCARHGVPMPAAALQLPLAHPAVGSVIPGVMSRAELSQVLAWARQPIAAELWAALRAEGLLDERAPLPTGAESR